MLPTIGELMARESHIFARYVQPGLMPPSTAMIELQATVLTCAAQRMHSLLTSPLRAPSKQRGSRACVPAVLRQGQVSWRPLQPRFRRTATLPAAVAPSVEQGCASRHPSALLRARVATDAGMVARVTPTAKRRWQWLLRARPPSRMRHFTLGASPWLGLSTGEELRVQARCHRTTYPLWLAPLKECTSC